MKLSWWREMGKSDEYVKKKLGLQGLSGEELTSHKNYPRFVKHLDTVEKHKLWDIARGGFSTYSKGNTEAFRIYKRFVGIFDENMDNTLHSGYKPPKKIDKNATPIEMYARAQVWAESKTDDVYVRMILGLENVKNDKLVMKPTYKYYKHYRDALI
ncbi:Avirulence protein (Avh) [Phytophthora palmivora]|uniref:Avirulence protein (Avh) n=1 Tax=Phytophthora palmivora TaxID=4796 RepID=A0A2P4YAR0_9STRA|nr:Avirulence protein (Avh) [Phytophthora palmivora]